MAKHSRIRVKSHQTKPKVPNVNLPPNGSVRPDDWNAKIDEIFALRKEKERADPAVDPFAFLTNGNGDTQNPPTQRPSRDEPKSESKGLELLAWLGAGVLSLVIFGIFGTSNFYFVTAPLFFILFAILLTVKAQRQEDRRIAASGLPRTEPKQNPVTQGLEFGLITVGFLFGCLALIFVGAIVVAALAR
jgi:hypothetical protein